MPTAVSLVRFDFIFINKIKIFDSLVPISSTSHATEAPLPGSAAAENRLRTTISLYFQNVIQFRDIGNDLMGGGAAPDKSGCRRQTGVTGALRGTQMLQVYQGGDETPVAWGKSGKDE